MVKWVGNCFWHWKTIHIRIKFSLQQNHTSCPEFPIAKCWINFIKKYKTVKHRSLDIFRLPQYQTGFLGWAMWKLFIEKYKTVKHRSLDIFRLTQYHTDLPGSRMWRSLTHRAKCWIDFTTKYKTAKHRAKYWIDFI